MVIKMNYVFQSLKYLKHSKLERLYFHSNFFSKNNLQKTNTPVIPEQKMESWGGEEAFNTITFIKENFKEIIQTNSSILVFFSAEWCKHCHQLKEAYGKASLMALKAALPIKFAFFDINIKPEIAEECDVVGIPIIKYYKDGQFISNYKGKRTVDDLYAFAKNPPTKLVESTEANY